MPLPVVAVVGGSPDLLFPHPAFHHTKPNSFTVVGGTLMLERRCVHGLIDLDNLMDNSRRGRLRLSSGWVAEEQLRDAVERLFQIAKIDSRSETHFVPVGLVYNIVLARYPSTKFVSVGRLTSEGNFECAPSWMEGTLCHLCSLLFDASQNVDLVSLTIAENRRTTLRSLSTAELARIPSEHIMPWFQYQVDQASMNMARGTTILVVGGGSVQKGHTLQSLKNIGITVVLIDFNPNCYGRQLADRFLQPSCSFMPDNFPRIADEVFDTIRKEKIIIDGVITYHEYSTPLAAILQHKFGVRGNSYESVTIARNKLATYEKLSQESATSQFVPRFMRLTEADQIDKLDDWWFPAVLKYCHGASAVGVYIVETADQARETFLGLTEMIEKSLGSDIGAEYGPEIKIVQKLKGDEFDVDIAIFNGKKVAAVVSDNGPNIAGTCHETTYVTPSRIPQKRRQELINAAYLCCKGIGLSNGVFNVELFVTEDGPKLVEINARPAGAHIPTALMNVWGLDIIAMHAFIALDIEPVRLSCEPEQVAHFVILYDSFHGKNVAAAIIEENTGNHHVTFDHKQPVTGDRFEKPSGYFGVYGKTEAEAREKTRKLLNGWGIQREEYAFVT